MRPRVAAVGLTALAVLVGTTRSRAVDENGYAVVISGTVVDESGTPVKGIAVSARTNTKPDTLRGTTDANGSFRLVFPSDADDFGFTADIVARGDNRLGTAATDSGRPRGAPVRVELKPARTHEIRVVNEGGQPVAGANVYVQTGSVSISEGRTDAEGKWTAIVPAEPDDWNVCVRKAGVGFDYARASKLPGSPASFAPMPEKVTLTLDGTRPPLRYKVQDRKGRPLPGINVLIPMLRKVGHEGAMFSMHLCAITDSAGEAVIDWLPKSLLGTPLVNIWSTEFYDTENPRRVENDPAGAVAVTMLRFEWLSGRVTAGDGRPVPTAKIKPRVLGKTRPAFRGETITGDDGRYALKVYSDYEYKIFASKDDLVALMPSGVTVHEGTPARGVDLVLNRGTHVHGRITAGKDSTVVKPWLLWVVQDQVSEPLLTNHRRDGHYEFILPPGEYWLHGPRSLPNVRLSIPGENPPEEIVKDFVVP